MSKTARCASISLCLLFVATAWAVPERGGARLRVVAFVPGTDAIANAGLVTGLRASLEGTGVRLVVGRVAGRWSNAAPETVRLVVDQRAAVLVTPPDRRVAHLIAQVATRTQVPVVSTSRAPTVGTTGSTWVECVGGSDPLEDWVSIGRRAGAAALRRVAAGISSPGDVAAR